MRSSTRSAADRVRVNLHFSDRALATVAGVLVIAGVFSLGVWVGRRSVKSSSTTEAFAKIESAPTETIEASTAPSSGANRLKEFKATLGAAADKMSETERRPLRAAQELVARMQPQMAAYEVSLAALSKARYVAPASIGTRDEIGARVALVQRFSDANEAMVRYFKNAERDYAAMLDELRVVDNLKEGVMDGFRRGGNFDLNLKIHESNSQLAKSMQEMLKLLDREWGAWRTNEKGDVIFDREDAVKEFETLQGELTAAAKSHEAAEKKLIERAAKTRKP